MSLLNLFRRSRLDREMHDEIAFHIQSRADDLERSGLTRAEAERRARVEFGGLEKYKEQVRDTRRVLVLDDVLRDLAYAWRSLRRTPVFTLTAAGAIALGVAVNITLFSLVYAAVFRPIPVRDPSTFRNVYLEARGEGRRSSYGTRYVVSFYEFGYIRSQVKSADVVGVAEAVLSCRCDPDGEIRAQLASDNLLPTIGATPAAGRFFARDETATPGSAPVAVLSHRAWQRLYGGALDVVGRTVVFNRTAFTIIGVADERTTGPFAQLTDVWIPLTMQAITRPEGPFIDDPSTAWITMFARRKPGVSDAALEAELALLGQQAMHAHSPQRVVTVTVAPAAFFNYPEVIRNGAAPVAIVFVAVSLVLLIACANVANMLLARGFARRREIAIRASLGAGRRRLLQQFLTESALLGVIGGATGLSLSRAGTPLVIGAIPGSERVSHQLNFSVDWTMVGYSLLLALAASVLFGVIPALRLLRADLTPSLKNDTLEPSSARRRIPIQSALVGLQAAVSLILLVNAGLLLRGFNQAMHMDLGQSTGNVLIATFNFQQEQYSVERARRFLEDMGDALSQWPTVTGTTITDTQPYTSSCNQGIRIVNAEGAAVDPARVACSHIGPGYFRTMHIRLLYGRDFAAQDQSGPGKAVIIDEPLARQFGGGSALGRQIQTGRSGDGDRYEIIGVVAPTKSLQIGAADSPKVYLPMAPYLAARMLVSFRPSTPTGTTLRAGPSTPTGTTLRAGGAFERVARDLQRKVADLDPGLRVGLTPIEENVATALVPVRLAAGAAAVLGVLAIVLASTGLYGVVAFTVGRHRREIGIRMALGADRGNVLRLIVAQGTWPVIAGGVAGLVLATAGANLLRALLFGVSPADPLTLMSMTMVLLVSAAVAAFVPARAALRIDPATTLRDE